VTQTLQTFNRSAGLVENKRCIASVLQTEFY
jgi:hypothetical protein